jgi:predicted enzyme related to lactoylglutathione lyase
MIAGARYGHANLVADDWRALSRFYQDLFGCIPVPPEREAVGDVVTLTNALGKQLTWVYVTDPEGNILELQSRPR